MKKGVPLILIGMLAVFSICACSVRTKGIAEEKLGAQEKQEGDYIDTAKKFAKNLRWQALIRLRKALGVRTFQSGNMVEGSESCLTDLADSIFEKGRTFACDIGLDFLYRGFCLYSPFSLLL